MSSPRKFAEKIALLQQKQAEDNVAFNTIIYEVEAAKQRADRVSSAKSKLDVPSRKYEKQPFEDYQESNGMNNPDNNYIHQSIKIDNGNESDRLLQLPDNSSWRRTHSDSSLHQAIIPSVVAHYHARMDNDNNEQILNYDMNDVKYEPISYTANPYPQHLQVLNSHFSVQNQFDFNHNYNNNNRTNFGYPLSQIHTPIAPTVSLPSQTMISTSSNHNNNTHSPLEPRYSGGSTGSNVLMLPPTHHPRGGSLPDLRTGNNAFHHQQISFSTTPSPPSSTAQHFFRSSPPQRNGDSDLYILGPQQQLPSNIGPLKQSPSMRRRHSPIGEVKQSSPRRQNSPSPEVSSNQQTVYRVEPSSPQSQSSYSPQNSPHLLPSPGNDHGPFSPQQSTDNNNQQQQQPYFTLPTHFDQITLDNNFYPQQQSSSSSSSPTSILTSLPNDMNEVHLNYFRPRAFYPTFANDSSANYCQTAVTIRTNGAQKSPTIPNIILTDVDSSKLDLSKELGNDFSHAFDHLMAPNDLQLSTDDFLLNGSDLSMDPSLCDDTFRMED